MLLLYDGSPLQSGSRSRGMGRYATNLLMALRRVRPQWDIEVVQHQQLPPIDAAVAEAFPIRAFAGAVPFHPDHGTFADRYFADWIAAQHADWMFHPNAFEYETAVPRYGRHRPRTVATLYDLIPLLFPQEYLRDDVGLKRYAACFRTLAQMDLLLAISQATLDDGLRLFGADAPPIVNVRGAVDETLRPYPPENLPLAERLVRGKFGLAKSFILYVGGSDFRKNMIGSIRGYAALPAALRSSHDFVVCCWIPNDELAALKQLTRDLGIAANVQFPGYVTDRELIVLYQICRLFFFPSKYEGLGLPPLEAMMCGAPVVTSNVSAMPEYGDSAAWQCDPHSTQSMADTLTLALAEPKDLRKAEREAFAAGFRWSDVAERAAEALERVGSRRTTLPPPPARRPRIAWVCPSRPSEFAIAEALGERFDLEWIVAATAPPPPLNQTRRWRTVLDADITARHDAQPYDLFVYHHGNEAFHDTILSVQNRHPGLAVRCEASDDPTAVAAKYATAIDAAIAAQAANDGLWTANAVRSLLELPNGVPEGLVANWAELRTRAVAEP